MHEFTDYFVSVPENGADYEPTAKGIKFIKLQKHNELA